MGRDVHGQANEANVMHPLSHTSTGPNRPIYKLETMM